MGLVSILILSACILHSCTAQDKVKRSIFSWSKETEVKEPAIVPGYLPPLTVHKYHGVQINPVNGPPIYLPTSDDPQSSDAVSANQFSSQLSPEYASQLEVLRNVVPFLPEDGRLQDYDVSSLLPYVDLISEDALARIQFAVESEQTPKDSKLLKLIGFLRYLKELKLKPFKAAANFGATLLNKKKQTVSNLLHLGSSPVTTPTPLPPQTYPVPPYPRPPHPGYPIHHPAVRPPHYIPSQSVIPSYPIQSPPLNDASQQVQLDQQPAAPSDNRVNPTYGHQQIPTHHQITPADTFLAPQYPAAPPSGSPFYYTYPEQYLSPSSYQPRYQYPSSGESIPSPHQQPNTRTSPEETYPKPATEQPANFHYQHFAGQEKPKRYPSTPADTYATGDLAGSASDNVDKINESSGPAMKVETPGFKKEQSEQAENHYSESTSRPKITKLRIIETRPPINVHPETQAELKSTDFESTPKPLVSISSTHQSKE